MSKWPNPLVPGFNPDPSVVLVDGTYYLATSTFEYLPGLPIYRSTDLVEWTHIGNVATRPEQVAVEEVPTGGGVWAPTIRYRDGVFYLIVTIAMSPRGCVVFTATDPAGPWSDGTTIDGIGGIDPDLAWDDDGNAYVTYSGLVTFGEDLGKHLGIQQVRVDLEAGKAAGGAALALVGHRPEVPRGAARLPARRPLVPDDRRGRHRARSRRELRPRAVDRGAVREPPGQPGAQRPQHLAADPEHRPRRPRGDPGRRLRADHARHATARDDAVASRRWAARRSSPTWPGPTAGPSRSRCCSPRAPGVEVEEFDFADTDALDDPGWMAVRTLPAEVASLTATPGRLTIAGDGSTLDDSHPRFVGRRQRHIRSTVSTVVDATAGAGGLGFRYDEQHHVSLEARGSGDTTRVSALATVAGLRQTWSVDLPGHEVELRIEMSPAAPGFNAEAMGGDRIRLVASPRAAARTCCSPSSTAASGPPR